MKALIVLVLLMSVNVKMVRNDKVGGRIATNFQNAQSEEEIIKSIRQKYLAINGQLKSFRKVENEVPDQSAEGGKITGYFNRKTLKKTVLEFYGEMGEVKHEYYFNNNELIFKFSTMINYETPIYLKKIKIRSTEENRFYFKDGKLIRWIKPKAKLVSVQSEEFKKMNLELIEDLKNMNKFLNAKN